MKPMKKMGNAAAELKLATGTIADRKPSGP
jgi:hypothetical protein